jgi:Predicted endonuclease distantly related to archaeal Holliday junction resolvase
MLLVRSAVRALDRFARKSALPAHLQTGVRGEDEAYFYLRGLGFTVVARDFRSPRRRGDVDLIAWEGQTLCFVEVKTRTRRAIKPAEAAVDEEKRAAVSAVAREYLRQVALARGKSPQFRFDVVSIYLESDVAPDITLFRDAFRMS